MAQYLALLRGINVGGNSLIKMADLKSALTEDGFTDVKTYIQSGNVFVTTPERSKAKVSAAVSATIARAFSLDVEVVSFTKSEWRKVIEDAPQWWGLDASWRHYLLVLLPPVKISVVLKQIGEPVDGIEFLEGGAGVVYSSTDMTKYSRTVISKTAAMPVYKRMTIRNFNTSTKLLALFQ